MEDEEEEEEEEEDDGGDDDDDSEEGDDSGNGGDDDRKDDDDDEDKNESEVERDAIVVKSRETCEVSRIIAYLAQRGGMELNWWYIDSMNSKKPLLAHVMYISSAR